MIEKLSLTEQIQKGLKEAIVSAFEIKVDEPLKLAQPPDPAMGDFAFGCFPLAKPLKAAPAAIASQLVPHLQKIDLFESVQATGPYINMMLRKSFLARTVLQAVLDDPEQFGKSDKGKGEKVLIEYSAPNTNKPLHLGHIRNNVLGISLTNLMEAVGYHVTPVNLINDRGVHICKSMLAYERFGEGKTPEKVHRKGDHFVGDFYVLYAQEEEQEKKEWMKSLSPVLKDSKPEDLDAAFLKESRLYGKVQAMLRQWEAGDLEVRSLWKKMNNWVYEGFDTTYARLGCRFEKVYHESDTYTLGKELVQEGLNQGIFYKKDDGSVWVDLTAEKLEPKLLLRGDGTSVYITQDLGTTKLKFDDFKIKRALWIVGDEQIYHFQVLFAVLKKLGFEWADGCHHLAYAMVDLPEGKMKSRSGTVVDADDLMDDLFRMEVEEIKSRDIPIPEEDVESTAEIIAQGALKFFILKFLPKTRMTFDPKESISPEGFTGVYVQNACVRIRSIFRKTGKDMEEAKMPAPEILGLLTLPEEAAVIRRLNNFPQEVLISADSMNPSRLCTYLFELARDFNRFYHAHHVLHAEREEVQTARLAFSKAVACVLENGLGLLGIDVPERM